MQPRQEGSPPPGRPSLIATDPEGQSDSQRLLAGIDKAPAARAAKVRPGRRASLWVAGVLVLAVGGTTALWMNGDGDDHPVVMPIAAATVPVKAPVAELPEVSAAAILQDTAADSAKSAPAGARPAVKPAAKSEADALTALLENRPAKKDHVLAEIIVTKPAHKASAHAQDGKNGHTEHEEKLLAEKRHAREPAKSSVKKAPAPEIDSDVALLAALVAHSKPTPAPTPASLARKLRQCKALATAAEASDCRARACEGSAKHHAVCKPAGASQVVEAS